MLTASAGGDPGAGAVARGDGAGSGPGPRRRFHRHQRRSDLRTAVIRRRRPSRTTVAAGHRTTDSIVRRFTRSLSCRGSRGQQKWLPEETRCPPPDGQAGAVRDRARAVAWRAGYDPIGMDHFALPDDQLARRRVAPGGCGATSRATPCCRRPTPWDSAFRRSATSPGVTSRTPRSSVSISGFSKQDGWRSSVEFSALPTTFCNSDVIQELMCRICSVEIGRIEAAHGITFADYFARDLDLLRAHEHRGLVRVSSEAIEVMPAGQLFVRNLAMCFDRYRRDPGRIRRRRSSAARCSCPLDAHRATSRVGSAATGRARLHPGHGCARTDGHRRPDPSGRLDDSRTGRFAASATARSTST